MQKILYATLFAHLLCAHLSFAANTEHLAASETQDYLIRWKNGPLVINAAHLKTHILTKSNSEMRLRADLAPTSALNKIYKLNVSAQSIVSLEPTRSHHFESTMHYGHETKQITEDFDYSNALGKTRVSGTNTKKGVTTAKTPKNLDYPIAGTAQDVLSALFYFRAIHLPKTTGTTLHEKLIFEGETWNVRVAWETSESIPVVFKSKKSVLTDVYEVQIENELDHKIYRAQVWIARNPQRTVIRAESDFKYGTILLQLHDANYLHSYYPLF